MATHVSHIHWPHANAAQAAAFSNSADRKSLVTGIRWASQPPSGRVAMPSRSTRDPINPARWIGI